MGENTYFYKQIRGTSIKIKDAVLEYHERVDGFESIVTFSRDGYRCGFVGIDPSVRGFEDVKLLIDENIIQSKSFSGYNKEYDKAIGAKRPQYWSGYSFGSRFDGVDFDAVEKFFGKTERKNLEEIHEYLDTAKDIVNEPASLDMCKSVNRSIIKDINALYKRETGRTYTDLTKKSLNRKRAAIER